ncbi:MAG TPA: hypothetical protein P5279_04330 [Anaerohalosphaeraceae bacterium]|jgi:hypothetical protein|nr:hypothetical protein [Anaerohalosphaeraceae bacterium]
MAAMAAASLKFLRCELFHARGAVFFFWGALKEDDVFRAGPYAAVGDNGVRGCASCARKKVCLETDL